MAQVGNSLRRSHGIQCQEKCLVGREALSNPSNDKVLNKANAHSHYLDSGDGGMSMQVQTVTQKVKKQVVVPVEEEVQVPVVRKEVRKTMCKKTIRCQRLVPVTKYKEVEETTLECRNEMVNGRMEKRAIPITQIRMQPYQDFEEEEYEMVIDVPMQEVVTRTGMRTDKQVVSRVVEVEQEMTYELRPVLVGKGEARHRNIGDHHKFKHEHGKPEWDQNVQEGWIGKPKTPEYRPQLHRPRSSSAILGKPFDRERNLLHESATRMGISQAGRSVDSRCGSRPGSRTGGQERTLQGSASDSRLRSRQ